MDEPFCAGGDSATTYRHLRHQDEAFLPVNQSNLGIVPATVLAKTEGLTLRVLLVDDYEPFRRFTSQTLRQRPGFQGVGEASDGLEAIRGAQELKPDLILLDIGLSALNGIAAAQEIRKRVPKAKIIFVCQESDPDIVQESLASGGCAYVLKVRAATELLPVIDAVMAARY